MLWAYQRRSIFLFCLNSKPISEDHGIPAFCAQLIASSHGKEIQFLEAIADCLVRL